MQKDTKDYIIDEAYRLFLRHSYEAVSISVISEAIGLTKGALYHHFKNKEELFKAVIDKHFSITSVPVDHTSISLKEFTDASIEHARRILNNIYSTNEKFVPIDYLSLIADSFRHYEGFAELKLQFFEDEASRIELIVQRAILTGEIRKDINIHIVAQQFFTLSIGLAGDIIRNRSVQSAIESLSDQLYQLYNLLKL